MLWEIDELSSKIFSILQENFSFNEIKVLVGSCGFNTLNLNNLKQTKNFSGNSKRDLIEEIEKKFSDYKKEKKQLFLGCLIEKIKDKIPEIEKEILAFGYIVEDGKVLVLGELIDAESLDYLGNSKSDFIKGVDAIYKNDYLNAITLFIKSIEYLANINGNEKDSIPNKLKRLFDSLEFEKDQDYKIKINNLVESLGLILSKYRTNKSNAHPHKELPTKLDALIVMQIAELIFYLYQKGKK